MDACKCVECACKAGDALPWPNVVAIGMRLLFFAFTGVLASRNG